MKNNILQVIYWEQAQMRMIELLLEHLVAESHLLDYLDQDSARMFAEEKAD